MSSTRFRARSLASSAAAQPLAKSALIVSKADGVASVSLNHRPVNALTQGVCEELRQCLGELEADPQVRGLLLGSALPGLFSAGLDLHAFHKPDPDALADYWTAVQELWLALWTSDLATVAAISGHCPAGGCMVALACDARVMVEGSYGIGLNEAQLGIAPPPWLSSMLLGRVGASRAERLLVLGELLRPAEAAELGLVDEVAPLSGLSNAATRKLAELLALPESGRVALKRQLRTPAATALREAQSEDLDEFIHNVSQPDTQAALGAYLASLRAAKERAKDGGA